MVGERSFSGRRISRQYPRCRHRAGCARAFSTGSAVPLRITRRPGELSRLSGRRGQSQISVDSSIALPSSHLGRYAPRAIDRVHGAAGLACLRCDDLDTVPLPFSSMTMRTMRA